MDYDLAQTLAALQEGNQVYNATPLPMSSGLSLPLMKTASLKYFERLCGRNWKSLSKLGDPGLRRTSASSKGFKGSHGVT
nr:unnamed protein product [Spirometra erinaceieuropaei]